MERRGQATDRHGRVWTATVLDQGEAEAEDLRFWREVAHHARPRATKDLDVYLEPTTEDRANLRSLRAARRRGEA